MPPRKREPPPYLLPSTKPVTPQLNHPLNHPEFLDAVLEDLPGKQLAQLATVSHAWCTPAKRALYKHIVIGRRPGFKGPRLPIDLRSPWLARTRVITVFLHRSCFCLRPKVKKERSIEHFFESRLFEPDTENQDQEDTDDHLKRMISAMIASFFPNESTSENGDVDSEWDYLRDPDYHRYHDMYDDMWDIEGKVEIDWDDEDYDFFTDPRLEPMFELQSRRAEIRCTAHNIKAIDTVQTLVLDGDNLKPNRRRKTEHKFGVCPLLFTTRPPHLILRRPTMELKIAAHAFGVDRLVTRLTLVMPDVVDQLTLFFVPLMEDFRYSITLDIVITRTPEEDSLHFSEESELACLIAERFLAQPENTKPIRIFVLHTMEKKDISKLKSSLVKAAAHEYGDMQGERVSKNKEWMAKLRSALQVYDAKGFVDFDWDGALEQEIEQVKTRFELQ